MTSGADELEVRAIRAGDAAGLVHCVRRCYGGGYPNEAFYDVPRLRAQIDSGEHGGAVALDGGVLVGHIAIRAAARGRAVVEAGTTIVDPDHRGRGVMGRLATELVDLCRQRGAAGFVHFPTTAHPVMQRASIAAGGRETGILLAYIPAQTADRTLERASEGRLAVTVVYQPLSAAPAQELFVPARYEPTIAAIAGELELSRRWLGGDAAATDPTSLTRSADRARSLERVRVDRIGSDLGEIAAGLVTLDRDLVHVDLPMSDAGIEHATAALLATGFVFGAWLPGWAGHDVLRMQRVRTPDPRTYAPELVSGAAAELMELIRAEARA